MTVITCARGTDMSDQYEVLTEALREHAKNVHGVADRVAQAVEAAQVSLPVDAYGVYCQILPCLLYTSPSPRDGLLSRMPSSA